MGEDSGVKEEGGCFFSYNFLFYTIREYSFFPLRPQKTHLFSFFFLSQYFYHRRICFLVFFLSSERVGAGAGAGAGSRA